MRINNKNKILFLAIAILSFASYSLAINKTFFMKQEAERLGDQVAKFKDIPSKLSILHQKEKYYDSILGKMDLVDTSIQNNLLRTINQEGSKNNIKVMDFNQPHVYQIGENNLHTFSFKLDGNYTNLLKVIHALEQKGNFGEVVHVDFEKKKNYRTNKFSLGATVFVQHVK